MQPFAGTSSGMVDIGFECHYDGMVTANICCVRIPVSDPTQNMLHESLVRGKAIPTSLLYAYSYMSCIMNKRVFGFKMDLNTEMI